MGRRILSASIEDEQRTESHQRRQEPDQAGGETGRPVDQLDEVLSRGDEESVHDQVGAQQRGGRAIDGGAPAGVEVGSGDEEALVRSVDLDPRVLR